MRKKLQIIIAVMLCICIALSGCKKHSKKEAEEINSTSSENITKTGENTATARYPHVGSSSNITVVDNQKIKPPDITGIVNLPADGIGMAGVDYVELAAGPANDWGDMKVPYFNPLGSLGLYYGGSTYHYENSSLTIELLDNYFINTFYVEGEYWQMRIEDPDFSVLWLRAYAKKLGAARLETPGDTAVFYVKENETSQVWVKAVIDERGCYLYVVRNTLVPTGKTLTVRTADFTNDTYSFNTECVSGKLQSVTVTLTGPNNSGVNLSCINDRKYGEYTRLLRKEIGDAEEINTKKANTFVFDDIPISEGQILWTFDWSSLRGTLEPTEITFKIENIADIEPIHNGEALGMLRIIGVPLGEVELLPGDSAENRHPDFDNSYIKGTRDKDGNTVFSLPSGYYAIRFASYSEWGRNDGPPLSIDAPGVIRLIPVNAGEITTVTIPREIKLTYGLLQKQYGTFESSAGNVEITDNKDNGDTATVSIVINDPLERDVFPEKEDITILEDGLTGKVTDIKRETAPADIILVLDSSGSMGDNMEAAVNAAKKFVERLPNNANIRFVQFEQKITEHKADTKAKVISALGTVKAKGGTALYDATSTALKLLEGKKKPYVVLFSDGADSRELKNSGKGSDLTKEQILVKIKSSGATVLTIGFGEGHDPRVLVEMSNASRNGAYFAAMEREALDQAFAAVSGKFGNQFTITYERPTAIKDSDSDIPVVSFMIDRSGSMDMDPAESEEDVGYRMDIVKNMLHDFVMKLPEGTLMQLGSFHTPSMQPEHIYYDQITTDRKAPVLQGIGQFDAEGGTPVVEALTTAYSYLSTVPSSKKTLIYFTDAALAGRDEREKVQLEEILTKMKKDGFRILFAGLGNDKFARQYQEAFSKAAAISGGEYIISDNISDIQKKLEELINRINQPAKDDGRLDFSISLNCPAEDGSRMDYGARKQVENFSQRQKTGEVIKPELVKITTGEKYIRYDKKASGMLYGSDRPNVDTTVLEYIPYETGSAISGSFSGKNKEINMKVLEAYYMRPFKGLELPSQRQALALNVELSLAEGAPVKEYMIPSIFRHFYVSINDVMSPASEATWLAQTPLSKPGDPSLTVKSTGKITGILVFIVNRESEQRVDQLSLHFYDMNYGHISIPLTGSIPEKAVNINALPAAAPVKLSDTFSLSINGKTDVTKLAEVDLYQHTGDPAVKNTSFRVLEGQFTSNMQALLNIDPMERFLYAIETDQGPLVTKMSDVAYNIPMGFTGSTMMAPGASAPVRLPFQLPGKLTGYSSYLFADLATGSVNLPVTKGTSLKTGSLGKKWSHEYFDITVNALRRVSKDNNNVVVLDFTLRDIKDGYGMKDLASLLALSRSGSGDSTKHFGNTIAVGRNGIGNFSSSFTSDNVISVSGDTDYLLYSANTDWAVLDGAARRGILLFRLPYDADISQWELKCGIIEDMKQPIEKAYYEYPELLAEKQYVDRDDTFELKLREAVTAAIAKYQSTQTSANSYVTMGLTKDEIVGRQSITPALTIHGSKVLESIKTDEDFLHVMYALFCVPNGERYYNYYSPEAVITQGWGTELDLARLSMDMLARLGYQPRILTVKLTGTGRENVWNITGIDSGNYIPGIAYQDSQGRQKVFVIPFLRDISELSGLAYISNENNYENDFRSYINHMTISVHAQIMEQPGGSTPQAEAFNSLNAMFGGEEDNTGEAAYEDIILFDKDIFRADMSLDAVDISFSPIGKSSDGQHEIIAAIVDTKQGIIFHDKLYIDTSFYDIKSVTVTIGVPEVSHTTYLKEGQKLSDIFQTLAYGVPGMTKAAADTLQAAVNAKSAEGKDAGDYATVKWLGHATVNRFVRELAAFEDENMPLFGIKGARLYECPLALMVTFASDGEKASATVDIMQHELTILNNADNASRDAFSSVQGIYVSLLEAYALGEEKAVGFLQVWTQLPKNTPIFVIPKENMITYADSFEENGAPPKLVERLREQAEKSDQSMFLVPKSPAIIDGKERYAWLEITDAYNGTQIISVSETGEHSAMTEYIVLNAASFGVKPLSAEGVAGFLFGITCIDWGIAAYSLSTDNYASIMAQAKVLVTGVGELLSTVETAADLTAKVGESFGDPQKQLEALEASYKVLLSQNQLNVDLAAIHETSKNLVLMPSYEAPSMEKHDLAGSVSGYSFSEGFKKAIEVYFP